MGLKKKARVYSPWVFHAHCGGCNGCDIEIAALFNPRFDVERFGIQLKNNPRHADILVVDGILPKQTVYFLKRVYEQTPDPKAVVAVGACAITGGVFAGDEEAEPNYSQGGPADTILPVDVYVPGCPPKPEAIMEGIIRAMIALSKKK